MNYCLPANEFGPYLCGAIPLCEEQEKCEFFVECEKNGRNKCKYGKKKDSTLPFHTCSNEEAQLDVKMREL